MQEKSWPKWLLTHCQTSRTDEALVIDASTRGTVVLQPRPSRHCAPLALHRLLFTLLSLSLGRMHSAADEPIGFARRLSA